MKQPDGVKMWNKPINEAFENAIACIEDAKPVACEDAALILNAFGVEVEVG